jgi:dihydroorotate dehydrogenase
VTDLYRIAGPLLRCLEAERAHRATIWALRLGLVPGAAGADDPALGMNLWGRDFPNPIGLAAGFDKNAEVTGALRRLGFGFVEAGTVTPRPQPGNPRPRIFRLAEDRAVINRLGFNSQGLEAIRARLAGRRQGQGAQGRGGQGGGAQGRGGQGVAARGILGLNLGANKNSADPAADYVLGLAELGGYADYVTINVSSPNTPGLRDLQGRERLRDLIGRLLAARAALPVPPPLLLKIAPDLSAEQLQDVAEVALETGIDGLIVSNTTISRPPGLKSLHRTEQGGLSGAPLFPLATSVLRDVYRLTEGRIPLVGVGGIGSGRDAYAKIRAGASLVQLYTALVYEGPGLIRRMKAELLECLRRDGFVTVAQAVGADRR